MNILISNDDGVEGPGLIALNQALEKVANTLVVAPHINRSASSAALTLDRPLQCHTTSRGFYSVTGTPCDCIHLGSHQLSSELPDMVIAGINRGPNLGDDVLYSGTVAAAMEGRHLGFPAVAISLAGDQCINYGAAADFAVKLVNNIKLLQLDSSIVLNVNVPDLSAKQIKGVELTRLGSRHRASTIIPEKDDKGEAVYRIGPPTNPQDTGPGTDFNAVGRGYISITPLVVDFTAYQLSPVMQDWAKGLKDLVARE